MNIEPGSVLADKFRLEGMLGVGGMGAVWRAWHLTLDAPVAVKVMNREIGANPEALERFHREARAAAKLRGPHVVQILDFGIHHGTPFIVMELLVGESLQERLARSGRLSPAATAQSIGEVARALTLAHSAGIVHRDLKPGNIFITHSQEVETTKVLDFGIAKWDLAAGQDLTRTGAALGTGHYMSPEQLSSSKDTDHRTDLWALGVIACECITGQRPFQAESFAALALLICTQPPPRPSSLGPVPAGFDAWFAKATARAPQSRFQSAEELAATLADVCRSAAVQPQPALEKPRTARLAATAQAEPGGPASRWRSVAIVALALATSIGLVAKRTRQALSEPDVGAPTLAPALASNVASLAPVPTQLPAAPATSATTTEPSRISIIPSPPAPTSTAPPARLEAARATPPKPRRSQAIKGNITASGKKLYHLPGCPAYDEVTIRPSRGERIFSTEAEAIAAGWHKANNCH